MHKYGTQRGRTPGAVSDPGRQRSAPKVITPVALLVLAERLRDDAEATVRYLLDQGVAIVVLSGNAPTTVAAIAARAGIRAGGAPHDDASGTGRR